MGKLSLINLEEQLKNILQLIIVGKIYGERESLCTGGGNVNWCNHYGKHYGGSVKKLKTELLYYSEISLLDIYLKKAKHQYEKISVQFSSVTQSCLTPWTAACQASLSITNSLGLFKFMPH